MSTVIIENRLALAGVRARVLLLTLAWSVAALLCLAPATLAQVSFSASSTYPVGEGARSGVVGDLNGDGNPDIVVPHGSSDFDTVAVLLGDGSGSFGAATDYPANRYPYTVALGDLDGDATPDLVAANNQGGLSVSVLLGNGVGGFGPPTMYGGDEAPAFLALGDINGDGNLDAAATNGGWVSVLLGDGSGALGAPLRIHAGQPDALTLADLNADGRLDLLANQRYTGYVHVLLGDGTGRFEDAQAVRVGEENINHALAAGDLNADGKPDLAIAKYQSHTVSVLLGDGSGGFGAPADFAAGQTPIDLEIADLDGDGNVDLAIANGDLEGTASVLLGDGSGGFGAPSSFAVGSAPFSIAVADFDRDGRLDLTTANAVSGDVSVLLNTTSGLPDLPTTTAACKNGGWRAFNTTTTRFKNQGDCVSFVTTAGKHPQSN